MGIVDRVKNICLSPNTEWPVTAPNRRESRARSAADVGRCRRRDGRRAAAGRRSPMTIGMWHSASALRSGNTGLQPCATCRAGAPRDVES